MAIVNTRPRIHRLSGDESVLLDSTFGSMDDDLDLSSLDNIDSDGFVPVESSENANSNEKKSSFADTKMVPLTLLTDGNTATQVLMLLEMVRYCMENSKDIVDTTTGEAKEYSINLKIRNRGKSSFLVSIGDEPMPPIPVPNEDYFIGS